MYDKMFRKIKPFKQYILYLSIFWTVFAVCFVFFFVRPRKEGFDTQADEIESRLASPEKTLVLFYADWCGHCQQLEPVWDETAAKSKGRLVKKNVGAKDVDKKTDEENQRLMDKFEIKGFPTIYVFQNGKATPYDGSRKAEDLLAQLN